MDVRYTNENAVIIKLYEYVAIAEKYDVNVPSKKNEVTINNETNITGRCSYCEIPVIIIPASTRQPMSRRKEMIDKAAVEECPPENILNPSHPGVDKPIRQKRVEILVVAVRIMSNIRSLIGCILLK